MIGEEGCALEVEREALEEEVECEALGEELGVGGAVEERAGHERVAVREMRRRVPAHKVHAQGVRLLRRRGDEGGARQRV